MHEGEKYFDSLVKESADEFRVDVKGGGFMSANMAGISFNEATLLS